MKFISICYTYIYVFNNILYVNSIVVVHGSLKLGYLTFYTEPSRLLYGTYLSPFFIFLFYRYIWMYMYTNGKSVIETVPEMEVGFLTLFHREKKFYIISRYVV